MSAAPARLALVAAAAVAVDAASKLVAVATLSDRTVPLAGGLHLTLVYNDTFARGMQLGALTGAAACALALLVVLLAWRACAPLARVDAAAPIALGLVAGAALGNAVDFLHTGRGAVDFVAVPTAEGALVFNLADVAAYVGAALLVRTAALLARAIRQQGTPAHRAPRERSVEVPVHVPVFARADAARADAVRPALADAPAADRPDPDAPGYAMPPRIADTTRSANRSTSSSVV